MGAPDRRDRRAGVFNAINVRAAGLRKGKGYETIPHGSSFVQAVQFVDGGSCPVVPRTILTYSQSTNPQSPFYADQTRMYGRKEWNSVPFCSADVLAATLSTTKVTARRPVEQSGTARGRACISSLALRGASCATWVARLRTSSGSVTWSGRSARRDGTYVVRIRLGGEVRRIAVVRRGGRFRRRAGFERRSACATVRSFRLGSPVFGGTGRRSLRIAYRLDAPADTVVQVRRGNRLVRTLRRAGRASGRITLSAKRLRRGRYTVSLVMRRGGRETRTTLSATRL